MIDLDAIAAGIEDGSVNETNLLDVLRGEEGFRLAVLKYLLDLVDASGPITPPDMFSGGVLQVVAVTPKTDTATGINVPPTWTVAYSGSITTTVANSRVIVACMTNLGNLSGWATFARIERGGTPLQQGDTGGSRTRTLIGPMSTGGHSMLAFPMFASEVPGAVGSYQYDLSIATETGGTWTLNRSQADSDIAERPRGVTNMFFIEVAP